MILTLKVAISMQAPIFAQVCPSFNHMPSAQMNVNLPIPLPGLRELFFTYQRLSLC